MLTIDTLEAWGANTQEGLARCLNNEAFYLKLVRMALADTHFDALKSAMAAGDAKAAFEAAHALKGAIGNLALTPIYAPVAELTERLRGADAQVAGGEALLGQILAARTAACALDA